MQNQYAIIVAGGSGTRLNADIPKQFILLDGKEIILHTIQKFRAYNPLIKIIIAVHESYFEFLQKLLDAHHILSVEIIKGGETRFHSVKNGLSLVSDPESIVGIHDAARPFVHRETIARCYEVAAEKGNAVPAVNVNESLRQVDGNKNKAVNRSNYRIIQTPQCFRAVEINSAYETEYDPGFTDDASVLEASGKTIFLVEGNEENIKITLPKDLLIAETLLKNEQ
jgi:2-C-methyl-D-erythritol 4-phosphate cytidylyltransferase